MNGQMVKNAYEAFSPAVTTDAGRMQASGHVTGFFDDEKKTASGLVSGVNIDLGGSGGIISADAGKKSAAGEFMDRLSLAADGEVLKDKMVLLSNTLSEEGFKQAAKDGYSLENVDPKEAVNSGDRIRATMLKAGVVIQGFNDDLSDEQLETITGSASMAASLKKGASEAGIRLSKQNVNDMMAAADMADKLETPDEKTKAYLIENGLKPTLENIYYAEHSVPESFNAPAAKASNSYVSENGYLGVQGVSSVKELEPAFRKVIEDAGMEVDDAALKHAADMMDNGIAVTAENFVRYTSMDDIRFPMDKDKVIKAAALAVSDGLSALQADVSRDKSLLETAVEMKETADEAANDPEALRALVAADRPVNLNNLQKALNGGINAGTEAEFPEKRFITARRQLEETRLVMTVEANFKLLKQGASLDTAELKDLVVMLKAAEEEINRERFNSDDAGEASVRAALYSETLKTADEIKDMPVSALGVFVSASVSFEQSYSIRSVSLSELRDEGTKRRLEYEKAGEAYETMRTEVRSDLGDSIKKAFANADSLMKELGIELTEENSRAVRILGYNSMEINGASVENMKRTCRFVDKVLDKMTPANVLSLIRNGDDPLKLSMEELDEKLTTEEAPEKYSEYLVDLREKGLISEEESESFIGIYRLIRETRKNDGAAIGALVNEGAEINFVNILSAVRSSRARGMDVSVDDLYTGMNGNIENDIYEQVRTAYDEAKAAQSMASIREAAGLPSEIYEELTESGVIATADHAAGLAAMRSNRGSLFKAAKKAALSENDSDSAAGILTDRFIREKFAKVIDEFDGRESAEAAYEEMADALEEALTGSAFGEGERIDVRDYSLAMKELHVSRELSRQESYEIPMEIDGEMSSVTVRILHEGRGTAFSDINMETSAYGEFTARIEFAGEAVKIGIFTSSETMKAEQPHIADGLEEAMERAGISFAGTDIFLTEHMGIKLSGRNADKDNSSRDTAVLYRASKLFIQTIGRTMDGGRI
ncbi:MAG: DUF6240 domain-containing protein [Lachnospiraceae bacterium]|nr:DUF6240 domain-containing protein [Lachnospiraceae bacterium]